MKGLPVSPRFALIALLAAVLLVRFTAAPTFTDAYYHFNAASRLASGQGLTDAYLWNYIGAQGQLPQPSHLYWMPLTSLSAAAGMALLNAPHNHGAAQILFIPMLAVTACVGYWLGRQLGGTDRHAWMAGLLTLFSGFFAGFWGAIDTFTPYAFVGSCTLLLLGLALERGRLVWWLLAGAFAALGHLTRADGLLLLIVGVCMAAWLWERVPVQVRAARIACLISAYLLVMLPWFTRNLSLTGAPLPLGGAQALWFRTYDDLFSYPPDASPAALFADGPGIFLSSRWEALTNNLGTFVVVEGIVILTPFMLIGLWVKRRERLLRPFWLYTLGLHLAMTFAFPFPGYRGGLFHSAAALVPFWMALGILGLDAAVDWAARRRRRWNAVTAKRVFSAGILVLAAALSMFALGRNNQGGTPVRYESLAALIPADARVMANDPAAIYYYTGRGGVVLPNEPPATILEIARRYEIDYLLIELQTLPDGSQVAAVPLPLDPLLTAPVSFLRPIELPDEPDMRLYAIER
jgi:4-amino-4-deoxy-L-arabinose transferase-like glycosyltransferase